MTREGLRLASRVGEAVLAVPASAATIALGAAVVAGRSLLALAGETWTRLWGGEPEPPATRHNAGQVRDQIKAARQAARAAGVLAPRRGRRPA